MIGRWKTIVAGWPRGEKGGHVARVTKSSKKTSRVARKTSGSPSSARPKGRTAGRKVMDCRRFPSESHCSLAISGSEEEVLDAAVHHAVTKHGHEAGAGLRNELRGLLRSAR
jgi:hypothetical protein